MTVSRGLAFSLLALIGLLMTGGVAAQCAAGNLNASVPASAPLAEFAERADGTLRHHRTRLVWQRCALGQTWDGAGCVGSPTTLNWSDALDAADGHVQADSDDWCLPNRNELASILKLRCFSPALDAGAFPDAPVTPFWTSTPASVESDQAWVVDFLDGAETRQAIDSLQGVRLVRGQLRW
jgi:hypothetical protein